MPWVVDTCILLDLTLDDPRFADRSESVLEDKLGEGLMVCSITFVELAPQFDGKFSNIRQFLSQTGVMNQSPWLQIDTEEVKRALHPYVSGKRQANAAVPKRSMADLLIGGFATRHTGLIGRHADHFRPYFPKLTILEP